MDKAQKERQLDDVYAHLNSIVDTIAGNHWWKDKDGRYMGCNQRIANFGLDNPKDIIGKTDYELPWSQYADYLVEHDQLVMSTEKIHTREEFAKDHDLVFLVTKAPLRDSEGNIIGTIGTSVDITAQKKLEVDLLIAKEKSEQIRQAVMILAGSIAHDLQSPLLSLELTMSFFQKKLASEMMSDVVQDSIQKMGDQINKTIGDMKVFINETLKTLNQTAKGSSLKSDFKSYHVNMLITHVLDEYPFVSEERKKVHWENDYPFEFLGNAVYFYRIMFNLIKNALFQLQQKGRGEIFISSDTDGDTHLLRFKDTAGSVKAETVQSLFQAYETTKKEGTGEGLAFCQLTMQSFGGKMTCHLVEGDCIEFVLSFPKIKPMSKESLAEEIEAVMKKVS